MDTPFQTLVRICREEILKSLNNNMKQFDVVKLKTGFLVWNNKQLCYASNVRLNRKTKIDSGHYRTDFLAKLADELSNYRASLSKY